MGRPKALLLYRGQTFLDAVLDMLRAGGVDDLVVVLGSAAENIREGAVLAGARAVFNPDHAAGQFSSVRAGIAALDVQVEAAVIALVDQPQVPPAVVEALVGEFRSSGAPVVRPVWRGRGGHPILFSSETFARFLELPAASTSYQVVEEFRDRRRDIPAPDGSVVMDVDTPEEFTRLGKDRRPD